MRKARTYVPPEGEVRFDMLDVRAVPAPPCERFSCRLATECRTALLACAAFKVYVIRGAVLSPYADVTFSKTGGGIKVKGQRRDIVATPEIYLQVFEPQGSVAAQRRARELAEEAA